MAPIRRYLRISKYSVLECRIYLENPADTRWLLDSRDPVLPRIFAAIKPLVLPKLREENERAMAKKKSNPVKDVIVEGVISPYGLIVAIVDVFVLLQMSLRSLYSYESPARAIRFSHGIRRLGSLGG